MTTGVLVFPQLAVDAEPIQAICAGCGRSEGEWSDPVAKEEERFCCAGCANRSGCTCDGTPSLGKP